jgi:hypothetical protein
MDVRWVGPDGLEVVPGTQDGRQVLRVRRRGRHVADCYSVAEVARHVDLADLCEVITLRPAAARARRAAGSRGRRRSEGRSEQVGQLISRQRPDPCMVTGVQGDEPEDRPL